MGIRRPALLCELGLQFRLLNCKTKVILPNAEVAPVAGTVGARPI